MNSCQFSCSVTVILYERVLVNYGSPAADFWNDLCLLQHRSSIPGGFCGFGTEVDSLRGCNRGLISPGTLNSPLVSKQSTAKLKSFRRG